MNSQKFPIFQEREGEWTSPSTFLIQGVPIHQFFSPDPAVLDSYMVNFETRAEDVFVVSYPKSGMQNYSFRKGTSALSFSKGKAPWDRQGCQGSQEEELELEFLMYSDKMLKLLAA